MLEKKAKSKKLDRIMKYLSYNGDGANPVEFSESEMEEWARYSFCHNKRKLGYTRKQVVDMLVRDYGPMALSTAYSVINETELVMGQVGVNPKEYMRVVLEEMILDGYRMAASTKNLTEMGKFIDRLTKLYPMEENKGGSVPADALERHVVYLTMNPEDVGMQRLELDDIKAFYTQMTKKAAPRLLDITPKEHDEDEQ